jgi:hypothetical protein
MNKKELEEKILKKARDVFETACTLRDTQRIEIYLDKNDIKVSDILEENEEILYNNDKVMCYQIYGHNHLEDEIVAWIDYARVIPEPTDDTPLPQPTDIEKSIRELAKEISAQKSVTPNEISSFEIFANMPVDLLGTIEQQIIEYWWSTKDAQNGKELALEQITQALNN